MARRTYDPLVLEEYLALIARGVGYTDANARHSGRGCGGGPSSLPSTSPRSPSTTAGRPGFAGHRPRPGLADFLCNWPLAFLVVRGVDASPEGDGEGVEC